MKDKREKLLEIEREMDIKSEEIAYIADTVLEVRYVSLFSNIIARILLNIKMIGATLVGITGNEKSVLAQVADVVQVLSKFEEACYLGLATTSSTTSVLCYGDALAVVASSIYGFRDIDFGKFYPAGALGKKLIFKVELLMGILEDSLKKV